MKKMIPNEYYNSIKNIDFQKLKNHGINTLLFDIDNTLVKDKADCTPDIQSFISNLKEKGFDICLISNGSKHRVQSFAEKLNVKFIYKAKKPLYRGFKTAMSLMNAKETEICMIGDQLFTDIYGANKLSIYSILIKPISKNEPLMVKIKRLPEKIILKHIYKKQDRL